MTDKDIKQRVLDELEWEPSVHAAHIGVTVRDEVVTLNGHVASYFEKFAANRAVKRVAGAKAIVEELVVRFPDGKIDGQSDEDIAHRALNMLAWDVSIPDGAVTIQVEKGLITLSGVVDWFYQRSSAESDMRKLQGVTGVLNSITVKPGIKAEDVDGKIKAALERSADLEASRIKVTTKGATVTLSGKVSSDAARRMAKKTAWSAPGVGHVEDLLTIG